MEFDVVRVQILGKEDLPSLNEVISIVRAKEGRKGVMLETTSVDESAFVTLKTHGQSKGREEKKATDKDTLWCTYCKKLRHTIEKCWKLHGKPSKGGSLKNQGQVYMARNHQ